MEAVNGPTGVAGLASPLEVSRPSARPFDQALLKDAEAPTESWLEPVRTLEVDQRRVEDLLAEAAQGRTFSPAELLALQAGVYRLNWQVEVAAKAVEQATRAARHALAIEV
jgi:hypothetical protein